MRRSRNIWSNFSFSDELVLSGRQELRESDMSTRPPRFWFEHKIKVRSFFFFFSSNVETEGVQLLSFFFF